MIADGNFPAASHAKRLVRADGLSVPELLDAIMLFFPLDTYLVCFVLFSVLFCFVLFCFVLFCFVLFCFVLFCFVLFYFILFCFYFVFILFLFCFYFDLFWFVLKLLDMLNIQLQ